MASSTLTPMNKENSDEKKLYPECPPKDIFRDTPVRLLGYANEVGESFRAIVPVSVVRSSYALAFSYVFADTIDKVYKARENKDCPVLLMGLDTLLWQTMASVAIPGFTINRICALSLYSFKRFSKVSSVKSKWMTTAIGLSCIPIIFKPIDKFTDHLMDKTFREVLNLPKKHAS